MKRNTIVSLAALLAIMASVVIAADDKALEGVKCLFVAKKDVNPEKSAKWKDGKVYFCCGACLGKFEKMTDEAKAEHAAKANSQLVATHQYTQEACPFTGGKLNDEMKLTINGAEVKFCCGKCKGKAEKMEGDEQVEKAFGEEAFKKGKFTAVKK